MQDSALLKKKRDYAAKYFGRPIHLTSTATVQPQSQAGANSQALHNPTGDAIELHGVKFGLIGQANANPEFISASSFSGGSIGVIMDLNGDPITNGTVPVWAMGQALNLGNEIMFGSTTGSPVLAFQYEEFVWYFPRPFFIGKDDQLNVAFQQLGQQVLPIQARASFFGRATPGRATPPYRNQPYATAYQSEVFTIYGDEETDSSTESELVNSTSHEIYLQRMIGRFGTFAGNNSGSGTYYEDETEDAAGALLMTQLLPGHGEPMVPYPTAFRNVFSGVTRSWELDGISMDPGDYIIAELVKLASANSLVNSYGQATISLVGWREVPTT